MAYRVLARDCLDAVNLVRDSGTCRTRSSSWRAARRRSAQFARVARGELPWLVVRLVADDLEVAEVVPRSSDA